MRFRAIRGGVCLAAAGAALAAVTLMAPGSPAAAAGTELTATPGAAKPGVAVVVDGKIPSQAGKPFGVSQIYTNGDVARVQSNAPSGGVAGPDGSVSATVTIPADAARSDILRPYGSWQYDVVTFSFPPGCPPQACTAYGANVNVLPVRTDEHITLSTIQPKTGDRLNVTATNCVGGILAEFSRVIDGNGSYFPFTGALGGTTFQGSADLSKGFRGKDSPTGAAHVSSPVGIRDSLAALPCAQSEGPASVAAADHLEHLSMVIDITICPRSGCTASAALPPAGQPPVVNVPADSTSQTVVPAASPAEPITAEPTFVG